MLIVDADGVVVGRMGSKVAKALLNGEEVIIVNAEKAIMTSDPKLIIEKFIHRRSLRNKQNPEKSPKWSKVPNLLLRRIIRGMLPRKKATGRDAFKRLKVYNGNPLNKEATKLEGVYPKVAKKYITMAKLCQHLGWRGE